MIAVPLLKASVNWKELLTLHLVADFLFDRPELHVNRPQLLKEVADAVPVKERGWQEALESIYPLKINLLRIDEGDLTYIDDAQSDPLRITHLRVRASNIRNINSKEHVYPSPVEAIGAILESGGAVESDRDGRDRVDLRRARIRPGYSVRSHRRSCYPESHDRLYSHARKDAEKSLFHKLYEKLIGGVAKLLENRERKEVATETHVEGPVDNPRSSTLQIVLRLIENAFFRAIHPASAGSSKK